MPFLYKIAYLNLQMRYLCVEFQRSVCLSLRPSVCPASGVHSVVPTVRVGSISYLSILSSNFRRCVEFLAIFWGNLKLWLCLILTWNLMWITSVGNHGATGGISEPRHCSCSSYVIILYCIHMNSIYPHSEDRFTSTGAVAWFLQWNWVLVNIVAADVLVFWYSPKLFTSCVMEQSHGVIWIVNALRI